MVRRLAEMLVVLVVMAGFAPFSDAAPARRPRLWVIQDAELVEYDLDTFARRGAIAIRREAAHLPELFTVNIKGQVLEEYGEQPWLWTGASGGFVTEEPRTPHASPAPGYALSTQRQWLLDANGQSVYLLENDRWEKKRSGDYSDFGDTIRVHFHIERYDIGSRSYSTVLTTDLEPCACGTGTCTETCPVVSGWAPARVVGDFLMLTNYVRWQLGSSHGPYVIYRQDGRGVSTAAETLDVANCLDADGRGNVLHATDDAACCGWSNDNSEQATFTGRDTGFILFQEWPTYHNESYDVSFTPTDGRVSPTGSLVAFTIHGIGGPNNKGVIPLNSGARPDTLAVARIRRAWDDMPVVEIHDVRSRPGLVRRVRRSEFIGWLTEDRILLLEGQTLVTMDVMSGTSMSTRIRAEDPHAVFLVRP